MCPLTIKSKRNKVEKWGGGNIHSFKNEILHNKKSKFTEAQIVFAIKQSQQYISSL